MDKLIDLIRKEYPSEALDIQECIALLCQCISGCSTSIKRSIDIAFESKNYSKMRELPVNVNINLLKKWNIIMYNFQFISRSYPLPKHTVFL
ncbi:MAG: hypothetical protein GX379_10295 [Clostridiales bacterium]|jgi:hypothetical protein|nr:hypothetical protein [Clostridiales bacterium]